MYNMHSMIQNVPITIVVCHSSIYKYTYALDARYFAYVAGLILIIINCLLNLTAVVLPDALFG